LWIGSKFLVFVSFVFGFRLLEFVSTFCLPIREALMRVFKISAWIAGLALVCCLQTAQADREIQIVTIADAISPGVAEFLIDAMSQADASNAACLIIALDTPGGLAESMRKIVQAMYATTVPVIVYVTPGGARAASAGVMITMAADIAAMAPGTNIGAAHPVGAGGKDIDGAMSKKVINDMVAFSKGIAKKRGRNEQWVEKAIRESVSITAEEAVKKKVVDLIASDMDDLIAKLNGRDVKDKGKLEIDGLARRKIKEDLRTRVLKTISNPNIAYILLMIGLAGLYFELSHPGAIFPGVVGGIALILAFFALQTLPVNAAGILLILLSIVFFILELKVVSYGMLSVAGVVSLLLGSLMLFKGAGPQFQVAWRVFLPTVALISGFFITLIYLVVKAHKDRPQTGLDGLVGEIGVVRQVDNGRGKVLVHGELWQAVFEKPVTIGAEVSVTAVDRLVVTVAPLESIESEIS
jgi:membrane-bound serine protease (ClpP class)